MASDKPLPPRLEDDLNSAKLYKLSSNNKETNSQRIAKVFDDSQERALYDEILGPLLGSSHNRKPLSATPKPLTGSTMAGNVDFNASILTRLKQVEMDAKDSRLKLAEKITENQRLQEENQSLKAMTTNATGALEEISELRRHNAELLYKLAEMESFLGDYGLVWVGKKDYEDHDDGSNRHEQHDVEILTDCKNSMPHTASYSEFNYHIDELNAVIYSEPAQVVTNQRKARLVQSSELLDTVRIVYYKNGLMIKRGPFRYCGSSTYKSFVKDILDGYFPSEFQSEYPDGVVFDLKDQRDVDFVEGKSDSYSEQSQMSRAQLLNRLPKTVIHKGQVIDMRSDIADILNGKTAASATSAESETHQQRLGDVAASSGAGSQVVAPKPPQKVVLSTPAMHCEDTIGATVQIQVKWVDQSTFIAKLYEHNTVGDLKAYILQHFASQSQHSADHPLHNSHYRNGAAEAAAAVAGAITEHGRVSTCTATEEVAVGSNSVGFEFELRSAYPPRALGLHLSLREAGLAPNGTVHAKKL